MSIINALRLLAVQACAVDIFSHKGLRKRISRFSNTESGVVTVEWVAVAAAVTIGAIGIAFIIMNGLVNPAQNVVNQLK